MTLSFQFLGTASGLPEVDRFGQTTVLTANAPTEGVRHFLLDVGDGAASLLRRHRYDFLAIKGIAISHMHGDHHGGFVQVIKTMMHLERRETLLVLAPSEGIQGLRNYLELSYLIDELLGFDIEWIPLTQAQEQSIEILQGLTIRAYANNHLRWTRELLENRTDLSQSYTFESYCFVLEGSNTRVVFSGNLDGPQGADELEAFIDPCDLLICELAHLDPEHLGAFVARHDVAELALSHFHPKWNDTPSETIVELLDLNATQSGKNIPVHLTRDGDIVEIRSSVPQETLSQT